jgi:hypothetical protein
MTDRNHRIAAQIYNNPDYFILKASQRRLRSYQREVLNAIIQSIREKAGRSFVVIFSRQSGKNELQAQMFVYLLAVLSRYALNIVSVSPTFKPQALTAMERLEKVLSRNLFTRHLWRRKDGFKYILGSSRVVFLSGDPSASVVGETAHILLSVDEAQSVDPGRFDKIFAPMAAAHNATRVFWGTSWTSNTLLARERRLAQLAEQADGIRRLWIVPGDVVAREVSSYASFLETEIKQLGRNHPIVRTQYFCEEIDAQLGMFNAGRRLLMQGDEPPMSSPLNPQDTSRTEPRDTSRTEPRDTSRTDARDTSRTEPRDTSRTEPRDTSRTEPRDTSRTDARDLGEVAKGRRGFAFLLDVAGQDEARMSLDESAPLSNPGRDSVSLTIATVDLSSLAALQAPTYRFVNRQQWTGQNHLVIFGKLKSLAESWQPQYIVIDATGVGEGLWALLDKAFPGRVIPVKFSQQVKSEIGWRYLAIIETGRLRDCCLTDDLQGKSVRAQYDACQSEILPGPGQTLRWGVPEGARGPDGELIHDDYLLADALIAELDRLEWTANTNVEVIEGFDPFEDIR